MHAQYQLFSLVSIAIICTVRLSLISDRFHDNFLTINNSGWAITQHLKGWLINGKRTRKTKSHLSVFS